MSIRRMSFAVRKSDSIINRGEVKGRIPYRRKLLSISQKPVYGSRATTKANKCCRINYLGYLRRCNHITASSRYLRVGLITT